MKLVYKGSYPKPKHEHGEEIPEYGIVQSRKRIHGGWEYVCLKSHYVLYFIEFDREKP